VERNKGLLNPLNGEAEQRDDTESTIELARALGLVTAAESRLGVCVYPEDGCEAPELLGCADRAIYASKNRRRAAAEAALPSGGPSSQYEPARL